MTTVAALKTLYVALGGSADTVADIVLIPDIISAIATLIASFVPGTHPGVKKTDEGKVLTVNSDGEWAAANLPAGNS